MEYSMKTIQPFVQQEHVEPVDHWEPKGVKLSNQCEQTWTPQVGHERGELWGPSGYKMPTLFEQAWTPQAQCTWEQRNEHPLVPSFNEYCLPRAEGNPFIHEQEMTPPGQTWPPMMQEQSPSMVDLREMIRNLEASTKAMVARQEIMQHKIPIQEKEVQPPKIEKKKPSLSEVVLEFIEEERTRRALYDKRQREFADQLHHQIEQWKSIQVEVNHVVAVVRLIEMRISHISRQEDSDEKECYPTTSEVTSTSGEVEPKGQTEKVNKVEKGDFTKRKGEVTGRTGDPEVKKNDVPPKKSNKVAFKSPTSSVLTEPIKVSDEVISNFDLAKTPVVAPYPPNDKDTPYVSYDEEIPSDDWSTDDENAFDVMYIQDVEEYETALKVESKTTKKKKSKKRRKAKKEEARARGNMFKEQLKVLDAKIDVLLDAQPPLKPELNSHSICYVQSNPPLEGQDSFCRDKLKSEVYVPPHLRLQGENKLEGSACVVDQAQTKNKSKKKKKKRKKKSFKENPT